jgi:hypothetical protein
MGDSLLFETKLQVVVPAQVTKERLKCRPLGPEGRELVR